MNNGEVIAAILTNGVFDRLHVDGLHSMNKEQAADAIVECYGAVLNKLKRSEPLLFGPDYAQASGQGA